MTLRLKPTPNIRLEVEDRVALPSRRASAFGRRTIRIEYSSYETWRRMAA
jgi:hypothetical protein